MRISLVAVGLSMLVAAPGYAQSVAPLGSLTPLSPTPYTYALPRLYVPPVVIPTPPPIAAPTYGSTYDSSSGNSYRWNRQVDGTTNVRGMNLQNGSMWNTTIKPDGSMRGLDSQMNMWNYNARTGTYMNYGTGELCVGKGSARTCTGGR